MNKTDNIVILAGLTIMALAVAVFSSLYLIERSKYRETTETIIIKRTEKISADVATASQPDNNI